MVAQLLRIPGRSGTPLGRYLNELESLRDRSAADVSIVTALRLRRTDALMETVFESISDGLLIFDENGRVQIGNAAAALLLGCSRDALAGMAVTALVPECAPLVQAEARATHRQGEYEECLVRRTDGSTSHLEFGVSWMQFGRERIGILDLRDISERKRQQRELEYQALHDALTGLPNRVLLMERMAMAIQHADEQGTPLALLMLDLDRFKEVNDTLGHHAGDTLLCEVAKRLATERRTTDTIARLGGDEFAVVLPAICNVGDAVEVARRMIHVLREPFEFNGLIIEVGVSIGIALFPDHAFEKDKLLQCADVAMYAAKQAQCSFAVYNYEKDHNSIRHLTISGQLRRAIEDRQIDLVYQPQLDLTSLRPVGVEALARWDHPVHGPISPVEFILHAERTGLIHDLTVLILDTALAQARAWHEAGRAIAVSVNISAKGLHNSGFPRIVADALTRWGITPRLLTLEITESAIMIDPPKALRMAKAMAEMGLRLSIDDFGTGYSSLSYLSHLPASELKIDKSFVSRMIHKRQDAAIVHSTIDLAHNLDLKVVAEGVEGVDILSLLAALGCDFGQGYYIGLPMTAEAASAWFEAPLAMDMVPFAGRKRISV